MFSNPRILLIIGVYIFGAGAPKTRIIFVTFLVLVFLPSTYQPPGTIVTSTAGQL